MHVYTHVYTCTYTDSSAALAVCNTASTRHGLEYPPTGRDREGRYREIFKLLISCANLISDWTGTIPPRRKLPSQLSSFAKFLWSGWDGDSSERYGFSFYIYFVYKLKAVLKNLQKDTLNKVFSHMYAVFIYKNFGNLWQNKRPDPWSFYSGHINRDFCTAETIHSNSRCIYYSSPQLQSCSA